VSRLLEFTKMHGAGNDFIVLDGVSGPLPPIESLARRLCDRHFGIGADQLLVVRPSTTADFRMEIFNADGGQVEMCANGIRAFFKYLRDHGLTRAEEIRVETLCGIVKPRWVGSDQIRVDMAHPVLAPAKIPTLLGFGDGPVLDVPLVLGEGRTASLERVQVSCVSMGNPHAVVFVEDVEQAPVAELGPRIEQHRAFPNRTNVEFVQVLAKDLVQQRTWERGTGETLACGSGACAVVVACVLRGLTDAAVRVKLRGGELEIVWEGPGNSVFMTGPAAEVFRGEIRVGGD